MAIKGSQAKAEIFENLQKIYPRAFFEDEGKILRIPITENGSVIEIKCQLTAAKNNLGNGSVPVSAFDNESTVPSPMLTQNENKEDIEPTQAEKDNVSKLLASLGL